MVSFCISQPISSVTYSILSPFLHYSVGSYTGHIMLWVNKFPSPQADPPLYSRALAYSSPVEHAALSNMADSQSQMMHNKRNGRYDDDYTTYQEQKKPMSGYPTKSLTQRRPLSARSYSTETYGASQVLEVAVTKKGLV